MDQGKEESPSLKDLMMAISDIASQNKVNYAKLDSISERVDQLSGLTEMVKEVKIRTETVEKKILRKTVIIHGISDRREETMEETEQRVRELANNMGVVHLDVDIAKRLGKFQDGKTRPVELTLVREKQLVLLMKSKSKLKGSEATERIYIDEACTPEELSKRSKLLKYAKSLKSKDSTSRFHFIRKSVLEIHSRGKSGKFHVNDEGNIVAWTVKTGDGTIR